MKLRIIKELESLRNGEFKLTVWLEGLRNSLITLISYTFSHPYLHTYCKAFAFTMAEILISLTIIGIIAAITLPSLRANINEKTWATQRKVLYSHMSQAISMLPSLNGYGDFQGEWADDVVTPTVDNAAEKFVTEGLAKVLKINNICTIPMGMSAENARKELIKCGIPEKFTTMGNSKLGFPTKLSELNPMFTSTYTDGHRNPQKHIDTVAAAFETVNGENIAVFYNPYCQSFEATKQGQISERYYAQPAMCANFIYDLNGKKGPNKVGKDIGFITAMYPIEPNIVAPFFIGITKDSATQPNLSALCKKLNKDSRVANRDELATMFYNRSILNFDFRYYYFSSSVSKDNNAWGQNMNIGLRLTSDRNSRYPGLCVKK